VFHTDVAKVDQDVVYIAMVAYVSHICCKCFIWMLRMFCNDFQVFSDVFFEAFPFQTHVPTVSSIFFYTLRVLYLNVSKVNLVLQMLLRLYTYVLSACFKCFICFRRILQVFHLDVLKIDLRKVRAAPTSALPWVTVCACLWWCCCCMYADA
jgi:hypothetical protein